MTKKNDGRNGGIHADSTMRITANDDEFSFADFTFDARIGFTFVYIVCGTDIGFSFDWSVIVPDSVFFFMWGLAFTVVGFMVGSAGDRKEVRQGDRHRERGEVWHRVPLGTLCECVGQRAMLRARGQQRHDGTFRHAGACRS